MMSAKSPQIIFDNIWKPLVLVLSKNQRAFLVHPGTTLAATELTSGWHWHWPLLTSIRVVCDDRIEYQFTSHSAHSLYSDEPVTAVSRDHQLFTIQGKIEMGIDLTSDKEILARLNRHSISRLFRPLIRQVIRQSLAEYDSHLITSKLLSGRIKDMSSILFNSYGLTLYDVDIYLISPYKPKVAQKPQS